MAQIKATTHLTWMDALDDAMRQAKEAEVEGVRLDEKRAVLRGEALRTATPEDAERITGEYEREDFLRFQSVGYEWIPTRKMLIDHLRRYIDEMPEVRRGLRALRVTAVLEGAAIICLILSKLIQ